LHAPPRSTPFPYTTLFRSPPGGAVPHVRHGGRAGRGRGLPGRSGLGRLRRDGRGGRRRGGSHPRGSARGDRRVVGGRRILRGRRGRATRLRVEGTGPDGPVPFSRPSLDTRPHRAGSRDGEAPEVNGETPGTPGVSGAPSPD